MAIVMILDRIAFCILLSKSTALSSSVKESEADAIVPRAPKDKLMNFILIYLILIIFFYTSHVYIQITNTNTNLSKYR